MSKLETYNCFEKKKEYFDMPYEKVDDFELLLKILGTYQDDKFIYRGLPDASYKIYSSFHRYLLGKNILPEYKLSEVDKLFKKQFKKLYEKEYIIESYVNILKSTGEFISSSSSSSSEVKKENFSKNYLLLGYVFYIFSILQHYGSKSPLVDFTTDIDIALYFCINKRKQLCYKNLEKYMSLNIIDSKTIDIKNLNDEDVYSMVEIDDFIKYIKDVNSIYKTDNLFNELFNNEFHFKPIYLLERDRFTFNMNIIAQKGCFVYHSLFKAMSLEENYKQDKNKKIISLNIDKKLIPKIEDYLNDKNISKTTMFPNIQNDIKEINIFK